MGDLKNLIAGRDRRYNNVEALETFTQFIYIHRFFIDEE
jgi:hypothetical protein